ncbi:SUF system Fe-S cluster assembly regulator [Marinobacterium sp. D7]|uniref:SUF system Fe-S cluster assembly regulator n=1 Tax=Marinobacterium ramblicola TaxID=2849041 RepID=UPI001C2CF636|nr:SUF system Fe-S cluster assembly regulator [Marinobacterium ramblicola]MBV1789827.1 SUF system Fe-S cluster assembly regulator [Marinobacterium ramblicola]
MLKISKLTDYGTVVLAYMARRPDALFSAVCLAQELGLPLSTVRKLLKQMAGAGLLDSSRGQRGGYRLTRPPQEISLAEVLEALEGPLGVTDCSQAPKLCSQEAICPIRNNWRGINGVIHGVLRQVSLQQLASDQRIGVDQAGGL